MRMKAVVLRESAAKRPYAESRPLHIEEVELDGPKDSELLVKITGAGLCHSDLSMINGSRPRPLPVVVGHEGAGEVVEVGSGVRDMKPGDRVIFQFSSSCGRCVPCLEGRPNLCVAHNAARAKGELMAGGKRLKDVSGAPIGHHSGVSCFAEYAVVDRGTVVRIEQDIPMDKAAIFGCAVMTGVGAVLNTAGLRPGETCAVIGLGGVGLNGLLGARMGGASVIVAIDIDDAKLGLARQLGATHTVNAMDANHVEQVRDITRGGVDYAFEFAGSTKALDTGYKIARTGGRLVTAGLAPANMPFSFHAADLVSTEKAIMGSYMGSCVPVRDIPRYVQAYLDGRLPVDSLISSNVTFDQVNAGFDLLDDGKVIRQILVPHAA